MSRTYKCKYCSKTFKSKHNRDKHQTKYCKKNPKIKKEKEKLKEKYDEVLNNIENENIEEQNKETLNNFDELIKNEDENINNENKNNEKEIDEDMKFLLKFFKNFNPERIFINKNQAKTLDPIYNKYGRSRTCDCRNEYTRMYLFLYNKTLEFLKNN